MPRPARPLAERFWEKADRWEPDGCWPWLASLGSGGYGQFTPGTKRGSRPYVAHRIAYMLAVGPIPEGMFLDHICRNRACVNPAHLHVVTNQQNAENTTAHRDSTTGIRGVYLTRAGRYEVKAMAHGVRYYGGVWDTIPEAEQAAIKLRNQIMSNNLNDREKEEANGRA